MGNCMIRRNRSLARDKDNGTPKDAEGTNRTSSSELVSSSSVSQPTDNLGEKKRVRFNLPENVSNNGDITGEGVVRIKVVVTQRELSQILKESKYSSVEQLVSAMKLRSCEVSQARNGDREGSTNGKWKPDLESIPEYH